MLRYSLFVCRAGRLKNRSTTLNPPRCQRATFDNHTQWHLNSFMWWPTEPMQCAGWRLRCDSLAKMCLIWPGRPTYTLLPVFNIRFKGFVVHVCVVWVLCTSNAEPRQYLRCHLAKRSWPPYLYPLKSAAGSLALAQFSSISTYTSFSFSPACFRICGNTQIIWLVSELSEDEPGHAEALLVMAWMRWSKCHFARRKTNDEGSKWLRAN